jgi:hypothetical protein
MNAVLDRHLLAKNWLLNMRSPPQAGAVLAGCLSIGQMKPFLNCSSRLLSFHNKEEDHFRGGLQPTFLSARPQEMGWGNRLDV